MTLAAVRQLVQQTFHHWAKDYAPSMGAALVHYSVFSMSPLLLRVIAVAGLVFGQDATSGHLMHELSGLVGAEAAASIQAIVASVRPPGADSGGSAGERRRGDGGCHGPNLASPGAAERRRDGLVPRTDCCCLA